MKGPRGFSANILIVQGCTGQGMLEVCYGRSAAMHIGLDIMDGWMDG